MTPPVRGPSLFTHVLVLAAIEGISFPLVRQASRSWGTATLIAVLMAIAYTLGALASGVRRPSGGDAQER